MRASVQRWAATTALATGLIVLTSYCGGGDGGGTEPTGSIQVAVNPTSLTLPQGGTGTVNLVLTRGGGFSANVDVTVTGLPAGITASVVPAQLTGTTTSAVVTVTVAASVAVGSYTATVQASATGVGSVTTQYTVNVTAAGNFSLSVSPTGATVQQGSSGTATVTITRTNFTGIVNLSLLNPPANVTATFTPASTTGTTSTVTINVGAAAATGPVTLTIQGSAPDLPSLAEDGSASLVGNRTTTYALVVSVVSNFTLAATPAATTIQAGTSGTVVVNATRVTFAGNIDFALDNPLANFTATFNPASTTGNSTTATISVGAGVQPGNYNVVIKGTADLPAIVEEGSAAVVTVRTVTVVVTVTAAAPTPSITAAMNPTGITIQAGGNGNSGLTLTRVNFAGAVTFTTSLLPNGMTFTFNPSNPSGVVTAVTVTVNVGAGVAVGQYPITITAGGTGVSAQTILTVTVTAGSGGGGLVEFQFGGAASNPVFFSCRSGKTGPWTTITAVLENGIYKYRCTLTTDHGSVYYVNQSGTAIIEPNAGSSAMQRQYLLQSVLAPRRAERARVAAMSGAVISYATTVLSALLSELQAAGLGTGSATIDANKTVTVPYQGVPTGQAGFVALGGRAGVGFNGSGNPGNAGTSTITSVPNRELHGLGLATGPAPTYTPMRVFVDGPFNPATGTTLGTTFDLNHATKSAPVATNTVTLSNLLGDAWFVLSGFSKSTGAAGPLGFFPLATTATSQTVFGVPNSLRGSDGRHSHTIIVAPGVMVPTDARLVQISRGALENENVTLPSKLTDGQVSIINMQKGLIRGSATPTTPGSNQLMAMALSNSDGSITRSITATAGFRSKPSPGPGGASRTASSLVPETIDDVDGGATVGFFLPTATGVDLDVIIEFLDNIAGFCSFFLLSPADCTFASVARFLSLTLP